MKKSDKDREIEHLQKALEKQKSENEALRHQVKLSKQQAKYAKETKSQMKQELKHVKAELVAEVKTPYLRKNSDRQHWQNLERKIKERFPEDTARSVLSELTSSFMSGQGTDSVE